MEESQPIIEMSIVDPSGNISSLLLRERHKDISYYETSIDILKRWFPAMLGMSIRKCVDISNIIIAGHMENPDFIAGVGLAVMTTTVLWFTFTIGMAGGIDTLSSQAFGSK